MIIKQKSVSFVFVFLIVLGVFASLGAPVAQAGWFGFGTKSFAATLGSFFSKIKEVFLGDKAQEKAVVEAICVPPPPARPANVDLVSKYGSVSVTPEVSTAGPNNIITISLTTNLDPTWQVGFSVPFGTSKDDLIDWYPKDPAVVKFNQYNSDSEKGYGTYGWAAISDKQNLPVSQTYWVKLRARHSTIPERAKDTTAIHGWRKISYSISNPSTSSRGSRGVYVGREQKPSLIPTIPNYSPTAHTLDGGVGFLKSFAVVPGDYFEIKTKSLGQPGVITLALKNAKILEGAQREIKADESVSWKIQPLNMEPVLLTNLSLSNSCGEDYFVDPAKSKLLADFDKFRFPVTYDFEKLKTDQVNLSMGARGDHKSLTAKPEGLFAAFASLSTKSETKVPVPDVPITFRATYADRPEETAKRVILKSYVSEKENTGEITIPTIKERSNSSFGSALVKMLGKKLTDEDTGRGIILTASAKKFPGLSAQMNVTIVASKSSATPMKSVTPKTELKKDSAAPVESKTKAAVKDLKIKSSKKLDGIKEGDKITFTATLLLSDGTTQSASKVDWSVAGQVGTITSSGVFTAKLAEEIAEYGEGIGTVVATYTDATGASFIEQTPSFNVEALIEETDGSEG